MAEAGRGRLPWAGTVSWALVFGEIVSQCVAGEGSRKLVTSGPTRDVLPQSTPLVLRPLKHSSRLGKLYSVRLGNVGRAREHDAGPCSEQEDGRVAFRRKMSGS